MLKQSTSMLLNPLPLGLAGLVVCHRTAPPCSAKVAPLLFIHRKEKKIPFSNNGAHNPSLDDCPSL
jgi:hypothetical protein